VPDGNRQTIRDGIVTQLADSNEQSTERISPADVDRRCRKHAFRRGASASGAAVAGRIRGNRRQRKCFVRLRDDASCRGAIRNSTRSIGRAATSRSGRAQSPYHHAFVQTSCAPGCSRNVAVCEVVEWRSSCLKGSHYGIGNPDARVHVSERLSGACANDVSHPLGLLESVRPKPLPASVEGPRSPSNGGRETVRPTTADRIESGGHVEKAKLDV